MPLPLRFAFALALVAAAMAGGVLDWTTAGLLAFGLFNAGVAPPGTLMVRWLTIAACFVGLALPGDARTIVVVLLWLAWPMAYLVGWALGWERGHDPERPRVSPAAWGARIAVASIIIAVAASSLAFRWISAQGLEQTAALFIGIPALLAIVVTLGVSPRSATGVACKAVTIGLLVSLLFLGEGMLCIVMSAPIFYLVAVFVGLAADHSRDALGLFGRTSARCVAVLALLLPMSLEGVTGATSLNRDETVSATRVVRAPAADVERALFQAPRFDRRLPPFLRAGFPRPTAVRIDDDESRWVIRFRGGEMRIDGVEPRDGDLVLRLEERRPGRARWRAERDDSHMTHYLDWRESIVEWEAMSPDETRVTWTLRYRRGLDPAWYFGPWERHAAGLAASYLIDAVATP